MSRNASGTYTLPSGNPVVSGTLIEASWANTTLSDLASAMTDSLSRSGQGGMTAALRLYDGTSSVPGLAWGSETTTGWYRAGAGDMRLVVTGSEVMKYLSTGITVTGTLGVSGNATVGGTLAITGALTLTANPILSAGTANGVAYLNGSKVVTTGSALTFDGTNNFTVPREVYRNASNSYLRIDGGSGTGTGPNLTFYGESHATVPGAIYMTTTGVGNANYSVGSSGAHIWNVNSEAMRLTSTGLGIGTSSPNQKLEVAGTTPSIRLNSGGTPASLYGLEITNGTSVDGYFRSRGPTGETQIGSGRSAGWGGYITFYTDTTERMRLDSSGNLGIGTSSPVGRLDVNSTAGEVIYSSSDRSTNGQYISGLIQRAKNSSSSYVSYAAVYGSITSNTASSESGALTFWTMGSGTVAERARIDSNGNLCIGTTSSAGRVQINGANTTYDTNCFGQVLVRSTTAYNATPRAGIAFSVLYNSAGDYTAGGCTIQSYKENSTNGDFATGLLFTTQAYGVAPAERVRINSSGYLGIGTNNPQQMLDVNGVAKASNYYYQSSSSAYATPSSTTLTMTSTTEGSLFLISASNHSGTTNVSHTMWMLSYSGNGGYVVTQIATGGNYTPTIAVSGSTVTLTNNSGGARVIYASFIRLL